MWPGFFYEREETELLNTAGLNVPVNLLFFNYSFCLHSLSSKFPPQHLLFMTPVRLSVGINRPPPMEVFLTVFCNTHWPVRSLIWLSTGLVRVKQTKGRNKRFHWINSVYSDAADDICPLNRLLYGTTKGRKDMVHHEQDDYNRQGESPQPQTHMQTLASRLSVLNWIGVLSAALSSVEMFFNFFSSFF